MNNIKRILLALFLTIVTGVKANPVDSIEISLLTCSPHNEVYSLYGHTALRIRDSISKQDWAVYYAVFDFSKPLFVPRFVFGLTDYEMGIFPFRLFCEEYKYFGSSITEQVLDLTAEEKARIVQAIMRNYEPQNREYRYNFFYKNCTTQARDVIYDNLPLDVTYKTNRTKDLPSYRELIHEYNEEFRWARCGNDLLLGVGADKNTTIDEQQFLPEKLMNDFDKAYVGNRKLVKEKKVLFEARKYEGTEVLPMMIKPTTITPTHVGTALLVLIIILTLAEWRTKKLFYWVDAILMVTCGLAGILLFLMLFSQHPTVRVNLQLLLLNPLPLFFVVRMIKRSRKKQTDWQFRMWIILICLFFAGSAIQHYAEGMHLLAASLLIRNVARFLKKA